MFVFSTFSSLSFLSLVFFATLLAVCYKAFVCPEVMSYCQAISRALREGAERNVDFLVSGKRFILSDVLNLSSFSVQTPVKLKPQILWN